MTQPHDDSGGALSHLDSLDDVRRFVAEAVRAAGEPEGEGDQRPALGFGLEWGDLAPAVAEPGPLVERAIALAGEEGLTLQQVRGLFGLLGRERLDRGLIYARDGGRIEQSREMRVNRTGTLQDQVVLRHRASRSP